MYNSPGISLGPGDLPGFKRRRAAPKSAMVKGQSIEGSVHEVSGSGRAGSSDESHILVERYSAKVDARLSLDTKESLRLKRPVARGLLVVVQGVSCTFALEVLGHCKECCSTPLREHVHVKFRLEAENCPLRFCCFTR